MIKLELSSWKSETVMWKTAQGRQSEPTVNITLSGRYTSLKIAVDLQTFTFRTVIIDWDLWKVSAPQHSECILVMGLLRPVD